MFCVLGSGGGGGVGVGCRVKRFRFTRATTGSFAYQTIIICCRFGSFARLGLAQISYEARGTTRCSCGAG